MLVFVVGVDSPVVFHGFSVVAMGLPPAPGGQGEIVVGAEHVLSCSDALKRRMVPPSKCRPGGEFDLGRRAKDKHEPGMYAAVS